MPYKKIDDVRFFEVIKHLIHDFNECIWVYDLSANGFDYMSESVEGVLGYTVDELKALTLESIFTKESIIDFFKLIQASINDYLEKGESKPIEFRSKQYDKKNYELDLLISAQVIVDEDNNQVFIAGVFRTETIDTTETEKTDVIDNLKTVIATLEDQIQSLSEIVVTDSLTGIYNRVFFDQKVNEYVNKYRTGDLSLLLLDIDYFKKVNDTFGHDVGDLVIKDLAILIKSLIDEQFIFSRWGGEEFTILLNNVGEKQALLIAENIRKNVEKRLIQHVGNITISIGATALNEEDTVDDFFKRADKALYKAKRNGRNRVEFIDEDVSSPYATLNLKFKKEWLSGNEGIDDDHKELVELTIRLVEESTIDLYSDETKYLIDDVIDHTIRHFIHEEKILEEIGYPEVYEHKKIHEELIQEVKKLRTKFTSKQLKPASFLSFLFDDLLMGHLVEEDAKFFKYTRNERLGK